MEEETNMVKSKTPESIAEYIKPYPKEVRARLQQVRKAIRQAAPKAKEAITYGIPTFVQGGNMIHFAGYKKHIGVYPSPQGDATLKKQMAPYRVKAATLQFPLDEPLPMTLIRKVAKARAKEFLERKKKAAR
jgi:uncharacterized protein YdhG (YjbR/CyaY superfamily)